MAKLSGPVKFLGTIDGLNVYKMENSDDYIARKKPGPTSKRVKTDPKYELTRQNADNFGGASVFGKEIRQLIFEITHLTYSYLQGQLTSLGKRISKLDTESARGCQGIHITKVHHWLTDFDLNKKSLFHTALRTRLPYSIDRETATALVHIPELLPAIQLQPPANVPFYRLHFVLGVATDIIYTSDSFKPAVQENHWEKASVSTEWHACNKKRMADDLSVTLNLKAPLADSQSLILFAGIEWGKPDDVNEIVPVPRKGCAKIMGLA